MACAITKIEAGYRDFVAAFVRSDGESKKSLFDSPVSSLATMFKPWPKAPRRIGPNHRRLLPTQRAIGAFS